MGEQQVDFTTAATACFVRVFCETITSVGWFMRTVLPDVFHLHFDVFLS